MGQALSQTQAGAQPSETPSLAHAGWSTTEPEEASSVLSSVYAPHRLTVEGRATFGFSFAATQSKDLTVGFNRFASEVRIEVPPPAAFYTLCFSPDGAVETQSGRRSMVAAGTTAAMLHPEEPWTFSKWTPGTSMMCVRVDRAALEGDLGALLGRPVVEPIDFGGSLNLSDGAGQDLARILHTMQGPAGGPSAMLAAHPLVADRAGQLLRSALLLGCNHNYSERLSAHEQASHLPDAVRRVLDAIECDPMQVCSAADAARIAHLSVRALEKAFEQHLQISPVRFARQARLARARAELLDTDPNDTTVIAVARRWGFGHTGRFAALYEQRYGELPSVTLRR